jgi:Zn-dependent protease with chaperone function
MPLQIQGQSFTGLAEYIDRRREGLDGPDSAPLYAVPVDAWITQSLNATPLRTLLSRAMDQIVSYGFGYMLANAIAIDHVSFPDLFEALSRCAQTLGVPMPLAVVQQIGGEINAFTAGTDDYSFIVVSAALSKFYTLEEATFVLGHECGHIACRHAMYQTLVTILTQAGKWTFGPALRAMLFAAEIPLLAWSRRAEVTGDRAGLLCCGNLRVAERALLHLVSGLADPDRVDVDDYLRRAETAEDFHRLGQIQALFASHPMIPKRIIALRLFARSEVYLTLSGASPPPGTQVLSRAELDRQVGQVVKP